MRWPSNGVGEQDKGNKGKGETHILAKLQVDW